MTDKTNFTWCKLADFTPAKLIPSTYGHYYANPDGIKYTSITTMLSKLYPFVDSPSYNGWMRWIEQEYEVGFIEAKAIGNYISKIAMGNGTSVHSLIEEYLNNKDHIGIIPLLPKAHFENIRPLLHNIENIRACEIPLYSDVMKLAGTADCIAEYNGTLSVVDFKTSNKKKPESQIENYFLQSTAYSIMFEELTGQNIEQIAILITCNDGNLQSFVKKSRDYSSLLSEKIQQFAVIGGYSS